MAAEHGLSAHAWRPDERRHLPSAHEGSPRMLAARPWRTQRVERIIRPAGRTDLVAGNGAGAAMHALTHARMPHRPPGTGKEACVSSQASSHAPGRAHPLFSLGAIDAHGSQIMLVLAHSGPHAHRWRCATSAPAFHQEPEDCRALPTVPRDKESACPPNRQASRRNRPLTGAWRTLLDVNINTPRAAHANKTQTTVMLAQARAADSHQGQHCKSTALAEKGRSIKVHDLALEPIGRRVWSGHLRRRPTGPPTIPGLDLRPLDDSVFFSLVGGDGGS